MNERQLKVESYPKHRSFRVYSVTFCLLLLLCQSTSAQDATIRGQVSGSGGETPLPLKVVLINKATPQIKAGRPADLINMATGAFEIRHVRRGEYLVAACSDIKYV